MSNTGRNEPCPCGSGKKYKTGARVTRALGSGLQVNKLNNWPALVAGTGFQVDKLNIPNFAVMNNIATCPNGHGHLPGDRHRQPVLMTGTAPPSSP
jgi:hypothetical protein